MRFRIGTLMFLVGCSALCLAVWHLIPMARSALFIYIPAYAAINLPFWLYRRRQPGPWSRKESIGLTVYFVVALAVFLTFIHLLGLAFPDLEQKMARWPG